MKIRLHSIYVPYDADQQKSIERAVQERAGAALSAVRGFEIARRSIDARQRPVRFVYSVDLVLAPGAPADLSGAVMPPPDTPLAVVPGRTPLPAPPVVIGGGPAGLFAALLLAEHGYRPVLLERGGTVDERVAALKSFARTRVPDPECNALFGLGGAGTFSDGKLRTGVNHPWLPGVMRILAACGASQDICVDAKPHVGTDILLGVVKNLAARIAERGGTVATGARVVRVLTRGGRLTGVATPAAEIPCRAAVLAVGHSARDVWQMLEAEGVRLLPKPFQIGIRVEHPQAWVDEKRYGKAGGDPRLGAADYKVATKVAGVPVFSFCMCPGGETMPTISEPGHLAINGMSLSRRDSPYASSGLVVTLSPDRYGGRTAQEALAFQRGLERACFEAGGRDYAAPAQRLRDLAAGRSPAGPLPATSYRPGATPVALHDLLPPMIAGPLREALGRFDATLRGYLSDAAVALAPESRASSPVRIPRHAETMESSYLAGLYPVGEGAGYAGGITSAALDGLEAARRIIERFAPPA